jgi:penicillin-binding protein 1A
MPRDGTPTHDWQQHYPTYRLSEKDVALQEYQSASAILQAEERVLANALNLTIFIAASLSSLVVGSVSILQDNLARLYGRDLLTWLPIALVGILTPMTLRNFAYRQKSIVYATRKIIVLRRMLGLSFGNLQLALPRNKVEGADDPFVIRMFSGWLHPNSLVLWIVGGVSILTVYTFSLVWPPAVAPAQVTTFRLVALSVLALIFCFSYRLSLLEENENVVILFARFLSTALRVRLDRNFAYVLYKANLARYEMRRARIQFRDFVDVLVFIEDRSFWTHRGVSLKATARSILGVLGLKRRSGGSTISQQLARSLLIIDLQKLLRRKVVEMVLALGLERVFTKEEILELYLGAVRFEKKIYGLNAAMKFFFGEVPASPTSAQKFLLIERIGNIRSLLLVGRVASLGKQAKNHGLLTDDDLCSIVTEYEKAVRLGRISCNPASRPSDLRTRWRID